MGYMHVTSNDPYVTFDLILCLETNNLSYLAYTMTYELHTWSEEPLAQALFGLHSCDC